MSQIDEIKSKIDIVDLVSSYVSIAKSGKNYKGLCPFHTEKTPSFMVSPDLQIFKCFGCGLGGDAFGFVQQLEGVEFSDALEQLAKRAGVELKKYKKDPQEQARARLYELNQKAADFFHHLLVEHKVGEKARKFLEERGVSKSSISDFNLGYAPNSWDSLTNYLLSKEYTLQDVFKVGLATPKTSGRGYFDFFRGRVIFPIRSTSGRIAGFSGRVISKDTQGPKYINIAQSPIFDKSRLLYNFDSAKREAKREQEIILVEGEMDVIALWEKGIRNVVASKGTALTSQQISLMSRFAPVLKFCLDSDTAGTEAAKRGILLAQEAGMEVKAVLLEGGKDPDEAIRADERGFRHALEKAPHVLDYYLDVSVKKHDTKTPTGKKRVVLDVAPLLATIENEVEKSAFIRKLAETLDVPESSIIQELKKEKEPLPREATAPSPVKLDFPKIEGYMFTLLLSLKSEDLRKVLHKLSPQDFFHDGLSKLSSELKNYLNSVKRFQLKNFRGKLNKDQQALLERLALIDLGELGLQEEAIVREAELTLDELRKRRFKRELSELVREVKREEKEGRATRVKKLQKEVLELREKIERLG